jgi:hypothetical protein
MAYNKEAQSPTLLESVGSYSGIAVGIGTASSTTLTVTVPGLRVVHGAIGTSLDNATAPILASSSGNGFTMTTNSGDKIAWMAWGIPKA